jgi:hypothetical protein
MTSKRPNKTGAHGKGAKRPPEADRHAVYFLSLSLENVRCFGKKQTLNLSDGEGRPARWTILLGNNGTGKTTVLQSLVAFESVPLDKHSPEGWWRPRGLDWRVRYSEYSLSRSGCDLPGALRVWISHGQALTSVSTSPSSATYRLRPGAASPAHSADETPPPLCYAYGAGRRLGVSSLEDAERDGGTSSLFSDQADLRNAHEWLLRLDYSASKSSAMQQRQQERLEQVRLLLINILPEVEDIRFTTSPGSNPTPRVEFQTPYGWVALRQLGYGYQTLIAWMVDFASRMVERYPDSADPLAEPAVVLVDEIDLHLHPQWQRKLIGHLTDHFPNTQFIVTAHSPLVVQAAAGANITVLRREGDHVVIDNDMKAIRGWRIDQIYTSDLFGLESARPPELDEVLKRRREILSKPKLTQADERELRELEAQAGDLPVGETAEDIRTMKLLRESLDLIEQSRTQTP